MADAFARLAEQAVAAGWREDEVAGAHVDLADCHVLALASDLDTERLIVEAIESGREHIRGRYADTPWAVFRDARQAVAQEQSGA